MEKTVIFISEKNDRLIHRLQATNPEHLIISSNYSELLSVEEIEKTKEVWGNTKTDPNRLSKRMLAQAERAFGIRLTQGRENLIVIITSLIDPQYLTMYERMSKIVHTTDCTTIKVNIQDKREPSDVLKKDFFFISGRLVDKFATLIEKEGSSQFISNEDMNVVKSLYLKAMNNPSLDLVSMHTFNFSSDDKLVFQSFPEAEGYLIQSIEVLTDVHEEGNGHNGDGDQTDTLQSSGDNLRILDEVPARSESPSVEAFPKGGRTWWERFKEFWKKNFSPEADEGDERLTAEEPGEEPFTFSDIGEKLKKNKR